MFSKLLMHKSLLQERQHHTQHDACSSMEHREIDLFNLICGIALSRAHLQAAPILQWIGAGDAVGQAGPTHNQPASMLCRIPHPHPVTRKAGQLKACTTTRRVQLRSSASAVAACCKATAACMPCTAQHVHPCCTCWKQSDQTGLAIPANHWTEGKQSQYPAHAFRASQLDEAAFQRQS